MLEKNGIRPGRWSQMVRFGLALACLINTLQAATVSSSIKTNIRRRVDFGYNASIVIGVTDAAGRDFYAYGTPHRGQDQLPDENTLYEIGSVSKVFTTSLLAVLAKAGEMDYDDPVSDYLPNASGVPTRQQRAITLEHLATHVSGLPNNPPSVFFNSPVNPFFPFPETELYEFLATYQLPRNPGAEFEYSNLGLGLLGFALGNANNQDYETTLRERLLDPLGLNDTTVTTSAEQANRRATGYHGVIARPPFRMENLDGAGAIVSTVSDLLTFVEHHLQLAESAIGPALQDTHRRRVSAGSPGSDVGLGWFRIDLGNRTILMHDGATMGHNSFLGFDPVAKRGVVVMTNNRLHAYSAVQDLGLKALEPNFPATSIRRPRTITTEALRSFYGNYVSDDGNSFFFDVQQDHLTLAFSGDQGVSVTVYPVRENEFRFYDAATEGTARFETDADGVFTGMQWDQEGQTSHYRRQPIAPQLTLRRNGGQLELHLTGDTNQNYRIEQATPLGDWRAFQETSIWDPPILLDRNSPTGMALFRLSNTR